MKRSFSSSSCSSRQGLSLMEVIIALAILGLALAAIGELIRVGARNAEVSRKRTTAQLLCENKLAEIKAGWLGQSSTLPTGQMMRPQGTIYGWDRLQGTLLNFTRYDKVVEALGGHGEFVERPEDIRPALDRAAASGKPALVNVVIRQDREYKGSTYV